MLVGDETKTTVILADDHEIVRAGLKRLLSIDKSLYILDEASNGIDAVDLVKYHSPDIAILDIFMPRMNGIEAAKIIKKDMPHVLVVMLTAYEDYTHIDQALTAGANAYLSKDVTAHELVDALHTVLRGVRVLSRSVVKIMQKKYVPDPATDTQSVIITRREQEILNQVALGRTSPEIAETLHISVRTVESHRFNLMRKLGVKNTASLVRYAVLYPDLGNEVSIVS